mgnify:CR=1 FL=1
MTSYPIFITAFSSSPLLGAGRRALGRALLWGSFSACGGLGARGWAVRAQGTLGRVLGVRAVASGRPAPSACVWSLGARALGSWGARAWRVNDAQARIDPKSPKPCAPSRPAARSRRSAPSRSVLHPAPALASPEPFPSRPAPRAPAPASREPRAQSLSPRAAPKSTVVWTFSK